MEPDAILLERGDLQAPVSWTDLFGRADASRPVELEIGCGKGSFLLAAARARPDHDFLAVEYSGKLARKVRDRARRAGLANVRLFHGNAQELVRDLLPPACLSRVHVYFPDPWPKRRHAKHRLFADPFPAALSRVLAEGAELVFATDHDPYFREVTSRLGRRDDFVRLIPEPPDPALHSGGFQAIFATRGVPVFRALWQKVEGPPRRDPGP